MDRKLDAGALLVTGAALALIVALFLPWFGFRGVGDRSAFEVFEVLDLVLLAAAGAAIAAALGRLDSRVLLGAAALTAIVVVTQLIEPPPAGQGGEREFGAWLALVASGLLLVGAALVAAQIAVTVDVRGRERRQRVAAVDKRAAEPAAEPAARSQPEDAADAPTTVGDTPVDRFAPPPSDPDATQPFAAAPDEPR